MIRAGPFETAEHQILRRPFRQRVGHIVVTQPLPRAVLIKSRQRATILDAWMLHAATVGLGIGLTNV